MEMTPKTIAHDWFYWALLSAVFAALTAIFAKIGLEGIDSDLATLIRHFRNHDHPRRVRV